MTALRKPATRRQLIEQAQTDLRQIIEAFNLLVSVDIEASCEVVRKMGRLEMILERLAKAK